LISDYRNKIDFNYNEEDSLLTVERNEAGNMGGGLCILNLTDVTFGPCLFESNVAYTGGAMLVRSTFLYAVTSSSLYNITVSRNRAYRGSGFALGDIYSYGVDGNGVCAYVVIEDGVEVYSQNYNIQFIENKASVAGTIYWLYNPQKPNVPPSLERCTYLYNTAPTGTRYTTQPMAAKIQEEYTVQVYGADLSPEIVITLLDYYNSTVTSDNITAAQAYVSNYSCAGNQGYLSSSTYEVSSSGAIVFDNLRAVCHPDGTLDSNFHVTVNDASYFSLEYLDIYHLVVSSKFVFRDCVAGEILTSGNCQQCKNSSYLLTYDVSKTSCDRCPQEADVCYSNYIYLKTGYWRRSEYTGTTLQLILFILHIQ
jgi:hypothetical protein